MTTSEKPPSAFTADLQHHDVGALLQLLEHSRRTGTAVIEAPEGRATIELRRGKVVAATAPSQLPFGRLVLETATEGSSEADRLIAVRAAQAELQNALRQIVGWKAGSFSFRSADETDDDSVEVDLQPLLIEAILEDESSLLRQPGGEEDLARRRG